MLLGAALLGAALAPVIGGVVGHRLAERRWSQVLITPFAERRVDAAPTGDLFRPVDGLDFKLTVPRLAYSEVVREGTGWETLALGPGHCPGTAWPGQPGDVGVAGPPVYWLRFAELRSGDEILLEARYGVFRYVVTGSAVAFPDASWILRPAPERQLTLTSPWPAWAGELATRRLVVFARQETRAAL